MSRILLTGTRAPATLHLARLLSAEGHKVFAADSCRYPVTRFSQAIKGFFPLVSPTEDPDAFANQLTQLIQKERIDLLIPTCEEIFHIAGIKNQLERYCTVFSPSIEVLEPLHHKWLFSQSIQDPDVLSPHTCLLQAAADINAIQPEKYVFKPVFSRFASQVLIKPSKAAVQSIIATLGKSPWIAQRYIEGTEFSSFSIAQNGKITLHSVYYSPYRAGQGAGIYFKPMSIQPIDRFIHRFVKARQYTGQIAFDFIQDREGTVFVLECNPRLTSGIHLFDTCDYVGQAYLGLESVAAPRLRNNAYPMLGVMMLLYGWRQGGFKNLIRDIRIGKDIIFDKRDPVPAFVQGASLAEMIFRSVQHKTSLLGATTLDIEWNGSIYDASHQTV